MIKLRKRVDLRRLALSSLLLLASCAQQPNKDAGTVAQAGLPKCTRPKVIIDRSFFTFFDRHSDKLAGRAATILHEFSNYAQKERVYRLDVRGHSDTSEMGWQDRRLAARRAARVKDFLVQTGIQADDMTIHDLGARQPLVSTPAKKPEPQNRYVDLRFAAQGSLEEVMDREDCVNWLRATFCKPLSSMRDAQACTNALGSL